MDQVQRDYPMPPPQIPPHAFHTPAPDTRTQILCSSSPAMRGVDAEPEASSPAHPLESILQSPSLPQTAKITIEQLEALKGKVYAVHSDLSILRGEFEREDLPPTHKYIQAFKEFDLATSDKFFDLESKIQSFSKKLQKRDSAESAAAASNAANVQLPDQQNIGARRLDKLTQEYETLKAQVQGLRIKLEGLGKNSQGVYDYEMDITFKIIGNQTIPHGYKKVKRQVKRKSVGEAGGSDAKKQRVIPLTASQKLIKAKYDKLKEYIYKVEKFQTLSEELQKEIKVLEKAEEAHNAATAVSTASAGGTEAQTPTPLPKPMRAPSMDHVEARAPSQQTFQPEDPLMPPFEAPFVTNQPPGSFGIGMQMSSRPQLPRPQTSLVNTLAPSMSTQVSRQPNSSEIRMQSHPRATLPQNSSVNASRLSMTGQLSRQPHVNGMYMQSNPQIPLPEPFSLDRYAQAPLSQVRQLQVFMEPQNFLSQAFGSSSPMMFQSPTTRAPDFTARDDKI